jgi:hypothetical protein
MCACVLCSPRQAFQLSVGAAMEHPAVRMVRPQMLARVMAVAAQPAAGRMKASGAEGPGRLAEGLAGLGLCPLLTDTSTSPHAAPRSPASGLLRRAGGQVRGGGHAVRGQPVAAPHASLAQPGAGGPGARAAPSSRTGRSFPTRESATLSQPENPSLRLALSVVCASRPDAAGGRRAAHDVARRHSARAARGHHTQLLRACHHLRRRLRASLGEHPELVHVHGRASADHVGASARVSHKCWLACLLDGWRPRRYTGYEHWRPRDAAGPRRAAHGGGCGARFAHRPGDGRGRHGGAVEPGGRARAAHAGGAQGQVRGRARCAGRLARALRCVDACQRGPPARAEDTGWQRARVAAGSRPVPLPAHV